MDDDDDDGGGNDEDGEVVRDVPFGDDEAMLSA
jgi:hypothetical protein